MFSDNAFEEATETVARDAQIRRLVGLRMHARPAQSRDHLRLEAY